MALREAIARMRNDWVSDTENLEVLGEFDDLEDNEEEPEDDD